MSQNRVSRTRRILVAFVATITMSGAYAGEESATTASLYDRLGAMDGIAKIVTDTVQLHHDNPEIGRFFEGVDDAKLIQHVTAFFAAGTGGPANYQGRDMTTTHASMEMTDAHFDSAVADVMTALDANGIKDDAKAEVAAILESLRPAVMGTAAQ